MSLIVDEHREYLADLPRVRAYADALKAVVRPGDVGLDLASGTGILGLLACQAGAARVYAIESGDIATLARQIAIDNGLADRITVIAEHSSRAILPERVDFIVTDLAGRFGFEAGLFEILRDARRRFLKPGGRLIPRDVSMWIAPVESADVRSQVDFWGEARHGVRFDAAHAIARSTGYPRHFTPADLLSPGTRLTGADLSVDVTTMSGTAAFVVARKGSLDGVAGWFSATLADGIELTNAPGHANRINRRNVFFPLRDRVAVGEGDRVTVTMVIRPESLIVRWRVEVHRGASLVHSTDTSTFSGMLLSKSNVDRTRPGFMPELTEAGKARRTVVDLCDGTRTVKDIEAAVFARHPQLFNDLDEATAFVAEVVTRYAI
jgi:protein arginine N-methyltransferase 1